MGTRGPSFHLLLCSVPKAVLHLIAWLLLCQYKGAFLNYVDKILPIIDHLPVTFEREFLHVLLIVIRENLHTVDISRTTYLPRLVNVVCECPLTFTGVKFGTKEPKTPVLPYTLEPCSFSFQE